MLHWPGYLEDMGGDVAFTGQHRLAGRVRQTRRQYIAQIIWKPRGKSLSLRGRTYRRDYCRLPLGVVTFFSWKIRRMETSQMPPTTHADRVAQLRAAQQQWSEKNLHQAPHRAIPCTTSSEIPIVPLATPLDWSDERYLSHLRGWKAG